VFVSVTKIAQFATQHSSDIKKWPKFETPQRAAMSSRQHVLGTAVPILTIKVRGTVPEIPLLCQHQEVPTQTWKKRRFKKYC
jgi:hypothetical protein